MIKKSNYYALCVNDRIARKGSKAELVKVMVAMLKENPNMDVHVSPSYGQVGEIQKINLDI